jgi:hypothetical protein
VRACISTSEVKRVKECGAVRIIVRLMARATQLSASAEALSSLVHRHAARADAELQYGDLWRRRVAVFRTMKTMWTGGGGRSVPEIRTSRKERDLDLKVKQGLGSAPLDYCYAICVGNTKADPRLILDP